MHIAQQKAYILHFNGAIYFHVHMRIQRVGPKPNSGCSAKLFSRRIVVLFWGRLWGPTLYSKPHEAPEMRPYFGPVFGHRFCFTVCFFVGGNGLVFRTEIQQGLSLFAAMISFFFNCKASRIRFHGSRPLFFVARGLPRRNMFIPS